MSRVVKCQDCGAETSYPFTLCWRDQCSGVMVPVETIDDTTEVEVTLDETREERELKVIREQNIKWLMELNFSQTAAELLVDNGVGYHDAEHLVKDLGCPPHKAMAILR